MMMVIIGDPENATKEALTESTDAQPATEVDIPSVESLPDESLGDTEAANDEMLAETDESPTASEELLEAESDHDLLEQIYAKQRECRKASILIESKKAALKYAKADYDGLMDELLDLARENDDDEKAAANDADRPILAKLDGDQEEAIEPVDENAWREEPLASLELQAGINAKLEEHGVLTIGHLETLRAEISQGKDDWPKGIGEAKITVIENAVLNWLTAWRNSMSNAEKASQGVKETEVESEGTEICG